MAASRSVAAPPGMQRMCPDAVDAGHCSATPPSMERMRITPAPDLDGHGVTRRGTAGCPS